jgi:hypothetical protein
MSPILSALLAGPATAAPAEPVPVPKKSNTTMIMIAVGLVVLIVLLMLARSSTPEPGGPGDGEDVGATLQYGKLKWSDATKDRCWNVQKGGAKAGTAIATWSCNDGAESDKNEMFAFRSDGLIQYKETDAGTLMCVAVNSDNSGIALKACSATDPAQKFAREGKAIKYSSKCMDIKGASGNNSTPIIPWDCNPNASNQQFDFV